MRMVIVRGAEYAPTLYLKNEVLDRLDAYIRYSEGEVSGLGTIQVQDGELVVTDLYLPEQECTTADTEITPEVLSRYFFEMVRDGIEPSELKLYWHSHANMNVFWSGTDKETIDSFQNGWMVSLVGNKKGEFLARLDYYSPIRVTVNNLAIATWEPENVDQLNAYKTEVEAKVRFKRIVVPDRPTQLGFGPTVWRPENGGTVSYGKDADWRDIWEVTDG